MVTPIQHRIYEFISRHLDEQGYSPSLTEIARGVGISPKSISLVSRSIHALAQAGKIQFYKKGYRNIQLTNQNQSLALPLIGRIAAGKPIQAIEAKEMIDFGALLASPDHFILEVKGESMIEEGILDGDFVICRQVKAASEGEIVVALIDGEEATLKRLSYKIPDRMTLIPANPALKPKAYLPHRVQIQGVFVGLLRLRK